ncbi:prepilin-type N-terminal cleavage/methylation domain-containing protein [Candidatus Peregrinibacteria bacterium]|nr:prepilin-type N-terminal cleavage/methylation domain-containing protein [Candidatus Peregrinibacteria bacterium]
MKKLSGFTLIELLIAIVIVVIAVGTISATSVNLFRGSKREIASNTLFEETRVLLDRISREIRMNTVDYDEYFNHKHNMIIGESLPVANENQYGLYYREYFKRFFYISPVAGGSCAPVYDFNDPQRYTMNKEDPCYPQDSNEGYFSTIGENTVANDDWDAVALGRDAENNIQFGQDELYLMSSDGKQKTVIKKIDTTRVGLLVLDLSDRCNNNDFSNNFPNNCSPQPQADAVDDSHYDSWWSNPDFLSGFIPISPLDIEITGLKFFISPADDPRKEYNTDDPAERVHPNVTILLSSKVSPSVAKQFEGEGDEPSITLETTISSRIYNDVLIPFEKE